MNRRIQQPIIPAKGAGRTLLRPSRSGAGIELPRVPAAKAGTCLRGPAKRDPLERFPRTLQGAKGPRGSGVSKPPSVANRNALGAIARIGRQSNARIKMAPQKSNVPPLSTLENNGTPAHSPLNAASQPRVQDKVATKSTAPSRASVLHGSENRIVAAAPQNKTSTNDVEIVQKRRSIAIGGCSFSFTPDDRVGTGGFGSVYRAIDKRTKANVAIKMVRQCEPGWKHQFNSELELLKSLADCEYVVTLLHHGMCELGGILVMELGEIDLRNVLRERKKLDLVFLRYWGTEVLRCVEAIHARNIVHSDIKPANFVLVRGRLKIIDFGISHKILDNADGFNRTELVGTCSYIAPEMYTMTPSENAPPVYRVTKPCDMWACGCILYEMVYGHNLFNTNEKEEFVEQLRDERNPVRHASHGIGHVPVPLLVHEVIRGCLDRDPDRRLTAPQALDSAFFTPRGVDYSLVDKVVQCSYEMALRHAKVGRPASRKALGTTTDKVWEMISALNFGSHVRH